MTLLSDERNSLIEYRIKRAFESFDEAKEVFKLNRWILTANRLYYTIFYACSALLISKGLNANTHAGIRTLIHSNFVKTGKLSREDGLLLTNLFNMRLTGDYGDVFDWDDNDFNILIPQVATLLNKIINLITK